MLRGYYQIFGLWGLLITSVHAANNLELSQVPLVLGGSVKPNIMFTLDDSVSMRWSIMPQANRYETLYMFPTVYGLYGGQSGPNRVPNFDDNNVPSGSDVQSEGNVYEATIYIKFYYNIDFWQNRVRFGLGEGLSYTSDMLWIEKDEAIREDDDYSKFLNYLDISLDFDLGRLIRYKPLENTYIGWTIKHRSGVFGLFNGVYGGSNYNTISIEKNF